MAKQYSLEHGSTVVVTKNKAEFEFIRAWCEDNKKKFKIKNDLQYYPFCLSVHGDLVGWTCETDRALYYMPFIEFLKRIGYRIKC